MDLMQTSDLMDIAKGVIGILAAFLSLPFIKGINFSRKKSKKLKSILDEYKEILSPDTRKLLENEINEDIMLTLTKVKNLKYRKLAVFIRSHTIINLPLWKWQHILPHIIIKNNRLYIRYNGRYFRYRLLSKVASLFYFSAGIYYWHSLLSIGGLYPTIISCIIGIVFILFSTLIWNMFPSKRKIMNINKLLLKIDTKNMNSNR
ncbi:TPA: hypothetical protein ACK0K3_004831 [Enterobacter hormaechei]|uniref:hypothetical protein n=1 Tax=Enterobacter cloacae complex TaxID=354276 RepID=UPI00125ADF5B|nr:MULTISPECIES: hypothetical protein [Enterobacter cloacae complex]MCK6883884.1 hypothetical protein [Enterobacter cloacae]VAE70076.1 Uncharacterised protein [Enterobacter hormaechei]